MTLPHKTPRRPSIPERIAQAMKQPTAYEKLQQRVATERPTTADATGVVTLALPLPPNELHPNARPHWAVKAKAVRKARHQAAEVARKVAPVTPWASATVSLVFYLPRKRDYDGLLAWCKAYLDGLQGVVIANDSNLRIGSIERFSGKAQTKGQRGVVLTIQRG